MKQFSALSALVNHWSHVDPSMNAYKILTERYFLKTPEGEFLEKEWSDVCRRVARVVATAELVNNPSLQDATDD